MGKKLWLLVLAACLPLTASAQAGNCTADVKVTAMGLQKPIDDTRRPMRDLAEAVILADDLEKKKGVEE